LHEIGHFKIKKEHGYKMPAEYKKVERLLRKEHPGDRDAQLYAVEDYMPKRPKETSRQWFARIESFKAFSLATLLKIMDMLKTGQGLSSRENEKKLLRCYKSKITAFSITIDKIPSAY
jgi:hypothetical protein